VVGRDDKDVEGADAEKADRLVLPDCMVHFAKTHRQVEEMLDLACCPYFASCSLAVQPQKLVSARKVKK
jgi:hypothetical protein